MPRPPLHRLALATLGLGGVLASAGALCAPVPASAPAPAQAAQAAQDAADVLVPTVVVSGSRFARDSFDQPAAVSVIDAARIGAAQARVNASEALAAVPGLVARDRQNYAQDLQISSRGFGARSAFGVRGVRLVADGIPATMPDGQGQAATFNLDMAERIEVLRGPYSALYGNHAGGVIQLFTRDGEGPGTVEANLAAGSYGARKAELNAYGEAGGIGYVLDLSRFDTDGYRAHSAARRDQSFAKLTLRPEAGGKLTLLANGMRMDGAQDPLGVKWETFARAPRAGEIDANDPQAPRRTLAERYDTRKRISHQQAGLNWERQFGADRLQLSVYGGNRAVRQYQSIPRSAQAAPSHSGGVIDFERNFYGANLSWQHVREFDAGKLTATAGLEYGRSNDERQGYENFIGERYGVQGVLRRDERDVVDSLDPYVQGMWETGRWQFSGGLRHNRMRVEVEDRFLANGRDSGKLRYSRSTPTLGVLYKVTPALNLYASAARGFEAPTLNELFYSRAGGFNFALAPSRSTHLELGAKARLAERVRAELALFQVRTRDELVVDASSGGRSSYRNAASTLRQGVELSLEARWAQGLSTRLAVSGLRAVYDTAVGAVPAGSRLPGVPNAHLFGELAWKSANGAIDAALEGQASGPVRVDDANLAHAAPGYAVTNLRLGARQHIGGWQFKQYVRLNNVLDRQYVGSVIVGDGNQRYYEAAPGRNWLLGLSARYQF